MLCVRTAKGAWMNLAWMNRAWTDAVVAAIHIIAVSSVTATEPEFIETTAGAILLWMEGVTIVFHAVYAVCLCLDSGQYGTWSWLPKNGRANLYKWLEYGISATLGGFAVAYANGDPGLSTSTQILLAGAGIAQQCSGFQLERSARADASEEQSTNDNNARCGRALRTAMPRDD
tara:strand:- start:1433 stop:1954 length:522 start_codon:yes stop_codon:yes gene_type:complete